MKPRGLYIENFEESVHFKKGSSYGILLIMVFSIQSKFRYKKTTSSVRVVLITKWSLFLVFIGFFLLLSFILLHILFWLFVDSVLPLLWPNKLISALNMPHALRFVELPKPNVLVLKISQIQMTIKLLNKEELKIIYLCK